MAKASSDKVFGGPKKCSNLFLSELHLVSIKVANLWHTDGQHDGIM